MMAQAHPLVLRLLASSVTAAGRAGKIIKDIMSRGELGIVEKGKNDLQTEADRSAQKCIITSLSKQFPKLTIIGEEELSQCEIPSDWLVTDCDQEILSQECPDEFKEITDEDVVIWVDPLDGTAEYTQGFLDHVTVLIGLSVKGKAVGGVIHQPYYNYQAQRDTNGRTLWGLIGLGVGGFTPTRPPSDKLIMAVTRSHPDAIVQKSLDSLNPDETLKVGGAGHKVLLLMEGKAHVYVHSKGCKKWDTCAPEGILSACGGKLTNIHGDLYNYGKDAEFPNKKGIFATAIDVDHEKLIKKLPQDILDALC